MTDLKRLMTKYGLRPGDVARICGVSVDTVYVWLSKGQTQPISGNASRILELSSRLYDLTGKWPI